MMPDATRRFAALPLPGFHTELSRSLLKFAERGGRASYPQFTATEGIPT
jgi:hypothetical protein